MGYLILLANFASLPRVCNKADLTVVDINLLPIRNNKFIHVKIREQISFDLCFWFFSWYHKHEIFTEEYNTCQCHIYFSRFLFILVFLIYFGLINLNINKNILSQERVLYYECLRIIRTQVWILFRRENSRLTIIYSHLNSMFNIESCPIKKNCGTKTANIDWLML